MRINIILHKETSGWILDKFAYQLNYELNELGLESKVSDKACNDSQINHHIIYLGCKQIQEKGITTTMITHIDNHNKLALIKNLSNLGIHHICMSSDSQKQLIAQGISSKSLSYVNPAHDSDVPINTTKIGIFTRVYSDGRKREKLILKLCQNISNRHFEFFIIGEGWEDIVEHLRNQKFKVTYTSNFDKKIYLEYINRIDYFIYTGMDEGQMAFLDAAQAGVQTIVTKQGFHLDAADGVSHFFNNFNELLSIFIEIQKDKIKISESVKEWTWTNYAKKHVEIWKNLLESEKPNFPDAIKYSKLKFSRKSLLLYIASIRHSINYRMRK